MTDLIVGSDNGILNAVSFELNSYFNINSDIIPSSKLSIKAIAILKNGNRQNLISINQSSALSIYDIDSFPITCKTIDTQLNSLIKLYPTDMVNIDNQHVLINFTNGKFQIWHINNSSNKFEHSMGSNLTFVKKNHNKSDLYMFGMRGLMPRIVSLKDNQPIVVYRPKSLSPFDSAYRQYCTCGDFVLDSNDLFVCGMSGGTITLYDQRIDANSSSSAYLSFINVSKTSINSMKIFDCQNRIAVSDNEGSLLLLDFRMNKSFKSLYDPSSWTNSTIKKSNGNFNSIITSMECTKSGYILTCSLDKHLRLHDGNNLEIKSQV